MQPMQLATRTRSGESCGYLARMRLFRFTRAARLLHTGLLTRPLVTLLALSLALALQACTEGAVPGGTPTATRSATSMQVALDVSVSASTNALRVRAFYARAATPTLLRLIDSATIALQTGTTSAPVRLDLAACLADPLREPSTTTRVGSSPDASSANTCVLHLQLVVLNAAGVPTDSATLVPLVARVGAQVIAPSVTFGAKVRGIALLGASPLFRGTTVQFIAEVTADSGVGTAVTWSSSAPSIASVSATGLLSGLAPGTAIITVKSVVNPTVTASATITVATPAVRKVLLPSSAGLYFPLTSILGPLQPSIDADPGADRRLNWSSSDTNVLTVDQAGLVTARALGTARVTASAASNPLATSDMNTFVCGIAGHTTVNIAGTSIAADTSALSGLIDITVVGDIAARGVVNTGVTLYSAPLRSGPDSNFVVKGPGGPGTPASVTIRWDTRLVPNGDYYIAAILYSSFNNCPWYRVQIYKIKNP